MVFARFLLYRIQDLSCSKHQKTEYQIIDRTVDDVLNRIHPHITEAHAVGRHIAVDIIDRIDKHVNKQCSQYTCCDVQDQHQFRSFTVCGICSIAHFALPLLYLY